MALGRLGWGEEAKTERHPGAGQSEQLQGTALGFVKEYLWPDFQSLEWL